MLIVQLIYRLCLNTFKPEVEIKSVINFFLAFGIVFLLSACSTTIHTINDEELSSDWQGKVYKNLLILGIYNDRPYRISAETLFAEVLKNKGINAAPSYSLLPRFDSLGSDEETAQKLRETDYDGVLAVATIDEGYDYDLGDYYATKGMFSLLGTRTGSFFELGSFISWAGSGSYTLYVGLYDINSLQPVWQTTTNSETTGSDTEDNKALAEFISSTLREKGLLK